ncbi:uncharacterized protein HMPREF1541_00124 [Cyphellophora europaea CBS 101466]|uniref:Uncharacterized protein n=1 Tax=Cyphellophora europaea (strain CBS 101466) TaxID=1220924 RepID=W2SB72_CYPE1|nr:uncharacterized protein HMPREF1541_00124 [Cyphellophora europaea CBS 101466]ETN45942.1 hypothetical protein HMPREF1541_00124 [Cyphellophora europaea CBS 101466]
MELPHPETATPSNTGRRRAPPISPDVTQGHVAQMQKLFQSAKASLRRDMAFAASPTGSIGSRLPPTNTDGVTRDDLDRCKDSAKTWRYSTAPGILLGLDRDVREPVPEDSPLLPETQSSADEIELTAEPFSSGFNSPVDHVPNDRILANLGSSPPGQFNSPVEEGKERLRSPILTPSGSLEGQMSELRVASDGQEKDLAMDESPLVTRAKRLSASEIPLPLSRPMSMDMEDDTMLTETMVADTTPDGAIFLSEPAKAAAESAKVKRGILRSLFPHRRGKQPQEVHEKTAESPASAKEPSDHRDTATPCPDPKLHELFSRTTCPNPLAHLTPQMHSIRPESLTPDAATTLAQGSPHPAMLVQMPPSPMFGALQPSIPSYQRASSTGSPMAFARLKSPPTSPHRAQSRQSARPEMHVGPAAPHMAQSRSDFQTANEHFQPGWYYTRDLPAATSRLNPMTYSFSTAAAKSVGQSAAPDSRIRDAYRTDTLTPLAKPPSRYRKTGIAAMASARGVSKYYGDNHSRSMHHATRSSTKRRHRSRVQFRSSPPPQPADMTAGLHKRRRSRDGDEAFDIREDDQVMELDDDTRAAIRMSLFGSETPEMLHARESLRELSPNVVTSRKDHRQRKKRRPSYWDGDLKEVQNSPAGREAKADMAAVRGSVREGAERKVLTSPPKEEVESLKSQRVEIEGKENVSTCNSMRDEVMSYTVGDDDILTTEDGDGTMMAIEMDMN